MPGEAITVSQDDDLPEGTRVLEWDERRVDLHLENEGRLSARPLDADGEPLDFAVVYRAPKQGDTSADTFVQRLTPGRAAGGGQPADRGPHRGAAADAAAPGTAGTKLHRAAAAGRADTGPGRRAARGVTAAAGSGPARRPA